MINNDIAILRALAKEYVEVANDPKNNETIKLHKAVNDLHMIRPIVLIDEIPWGEMNFDGLLDLHCTDPYLKTVENQMRRTLYKWKYFPADMVVLPYIGIQKVIYSTGLGMNAKEEVLATENKNSVVSHSYENQFEDMEDVEKLHYMTITYDEKETLRRYELVANAIGDIIPVKIIGIDTGYGVGFITWDKIAQLMGVDNLLYGIIDEPELMHAIVDRLTNIYIDQLDQFEKLNLFNSEAIYCHSSAASSDDLAKNPCDPEHVTRKNVWGRGLAQILETVSPEMHEELDINYMIKGLAQFGLNYYGCCEALHNKIDIVKKIPNLRKISISPWANGDIAAEAISTDYVFSTKPNPSIVAQKTIDLNAAEAEVKHMLDAAKRNKCHTEILLKDISTVEFRPQNLFEWEQMAMKQVKSF